MKRKKAKKMLRALRKAQRICEGQVTCTGCVFGLWDRVGTACLLDDLPTQWHLEELEKRMLQTKEDTKGNTDGER